MELALLLYVILGYWATGKTLYANKIVFYTKFGDLFIQRVAWGTFWGWILIPWALIKLLLSYKNM